MRGGLSHLIPVFSRDFLSGLCMVWRGGTGVMREQGLSRLTPVSFRGSVLDFGRLITSRHVLSLRVSPAICFFLLSITYPMPTIICALAYHDVLR